jgi:hypothetical protein
MKGFVFPVVITAIIVLVVGRALTFFNIGWRNEFVIRWWSAFAIGWPIAASTAYLAMPFARSLTQRIVAAVDPRRFRSEGSGLGQFAADAFGDTSIQAHERAVDRMIRR